LCVIPLAGDRWRGSRDGSGAAAFGLDVGQQVAVASLAEQVAGVQVTFAPGFLGRLCELPVVKARAQAAGDRLVVPGALVVASSPSGTNVLAAMMMAAGGWQGPLIIARSRERSRREAFELELSDALGEMVMGVEAGLTLESVMQQYARRHSSSLASEFSLVLDRVSLGYPRVAALEEFAARTPVPGVRLFVSAVQQNQMLGVPLADVLRQQSDTARRRRRQAVEEHAAKLSLKMIFPTVFCILPVLLVVICGPSIVRLMEALSR